jgi:hypothetical protein
MMILEGAASSAAGGIDSTLQTTLTTVNQAEAHPLSSQFNSYASVPGLPPTSLESELRRQYMHQPDRVGAESSLISTLRQPHGHNVSSRLPQTPEQPLHHQSDDDDDADAS